MDEHVVDEREQVLADAATQFGVGVVVGHEVVGRPGNANTTPFQYLQLPVECGGTSLVYPTHMAGVRFCGPMQMQPIALVEASGFDAQDMWRRNVQAFAA